MLPPLREGVPPLEAVGHTEWPAPDALASMAQVLHDQIKPAGITVQDYECEMEERTQKGLY